MESPDETTEEVVSEEASVTEGPDPSPSETDAPPEPSASDAEPAEVLPPKERRRRARAEKAENAGSRPERTAEERQSERDEQRRRKAVARRVQRQRSRAKARAGRDSGAQTPPRERQPGTQKTRQGIVVSDRAEKTITVRIDVARRHPRYSKIVRTSTTLHAHDESSDAGVGDTVLVREARPLSRTKRWRLVRVLERAQ